MSTIKTLIEKHLDEDLQDALMNQFDDDPFIEKRRDPPKTILEPLPSELKYALLSENKTWPIVIPRSY